MNPIDTVKIQLSVVLGKSIMPINQLLRMGRGAVIELDVGEEDQVTILANNVLIARGEVIVKNDRIAVVVDTLVESGVSVSTPAE
ncbi:MAG: FliM/FliN family flagellar motor switch protein [Alphaproteobacteria bacterium]